METNQNLRLSFQDLPPKLRIYVKCRLDGMTQIASAQAAGSKNPKSDGPKWEKDERVQQAVIEASNAMADEVGFSRKEAHDMLIQAYNNAETATEQVSAVRELINLHGVAKPKEIKHTHDHQHTHALEDMTTDELMKLAEMEDLALEGEYEVIEEDAPQLEGPAEEPEESDGPGYQEVLS